MAVATSTLLMAAAATAAVSSIAGGIQANKAAKQQAKIAMEDANAAAKLRSKEITKLRNYQQAQFNASGVTLDGTPLLVLDETQREGDEEVADILRQGRNNSKVIRAQGRQALTSGITGALGSVASAGMSAYGAAGTGSGAGTVADTGRQVGVGYGTGGLY